MIGALAALLAGAALGVGARLLIGPVPVDRAAPAAPDAVVLAATTQRNEAEVADPDELRSLVERAVVRADAEACEKVRQGTVTMVRTDAGPLGLTNAHVVRGADTITLSGAGLGVAEVHVVDHLAGRDAATVDPEPLHPSADAALEVGGAVNVGDAVTTAGFPAGRWQVRSGRVVATRLRSVSGGTGDVFVVDVPARPGTSGGVVVDRAGRAVGLIAARDPRTGYILAHPMGEVLSRPPGATAGC